MPITRLSAMALAFGCWNCTDDPAEMEKFCQSMMAFPLDCVISVVFAFGELTLIWPATTDAPVGPASVG